MLGSLRQQGHRLVVDAVDRVDLARDQRVETRGPVVDDGHVHAVQKAFALLPIRSRLLEPDPDSRIEVFEHERTGADRLRPVLEAVRNHHEMIVREAIRKIGVGSGERNLDLVVVELLDVGDVLHRGGAAGLRVAAVEVERIDRVVGIEFLAVRKGHAFAKVQDPVFGAVGRLPALRQFRMGFSVLTPFGEAIPEAVIGIDHHGIGRGAEVEAVGGAAAGEAELQHPAIFWRIGGNRVGARQ